MSKRLAYSLIATLLISLITIDRLGHASVPPDSSKIRPGDSAATGKAPARKAPTGKAPAATGGGGCAVCPAAQGEAPPIYAGSYAKSAGHAANYPLKPASRSLFEGYPINLVNTANGSLSFTVNDIELHNGMTSIAFSRVYASDRETDFGLGRGWSFLFDDRIRVKGNAATMTSGAGPLISFRRDGHGKRFILEIPQAGPHQSFDLTDSGEIVEAVNGYSRTYSRIGKEYRLRTIADPVGNNIDISYDQRGRLESIAGGGLKIALSWSGGERAQLLGVADSTGRRLSFSQSHRLLRSVTDPTNARWTYDYNSAGLLKLATDPMQRTLLQAEYNKSGLVLGAGDALGTHRYEYTPWSEGARISRRTVVIDSMGTRTNFEHNISGAPVRISDDDGGSVAFEYNSSNRIERVLSTAGNELKYTYDSQQRLVDVWSNNASHQSFTFDERGYLSSVTNGDIRTSYSHDQRGNTVAVDTGSPESSYTASFNQRGQAISLSSGIGQQVTLEYDAAGNHAGVVFPEVGRFADTYDSAGRLTSSRLPTGYTDYYEYDARGMLAKRSNSLGKWKVYQRDASGLIARVYDQDNRWIQSSRDEMGRITSLATWKGESSRYSYDSRGALTSVSDLEGDYYQFSYDKRGRLLDSNKDVWLPACWDVEFECCCPETDPECSFCNGGGGGGDGGGGDGGGGGGGGGEQTAQCLQCWTNEKVACKDSWNACMIAAAGIAAGAAIEGAEAALWICTLTTGWLGPEAIIACQAAAGVAAAGAAFYGAKVACDYLYNGCMITSKNRCSTCT